MIMCPSPTSPKMDLTASKMLHKSPDSSSQMPSTIESIVEQLSQWANKTFRKMHKLTLKIPDCILLFVHIYLVSRLHSVVINTIFSFHFVFAEISLDRQRQPKGIYLMETECDFVKLNFVLYFQHTNVVFKCEFYVHFLLDSLVRW